MKKQTMFYEDENNWALLAEDIQVDEDLLSVLPLELQLLIADALGGRCDRAALALASPRLLGLAACLELTSYQGLEMSLAFHHVLGGAIDEQLLRRYASRSEATPEGCEWLAGAAAAAGVLVEIRVVVSGIVEQWFLVQPDSTDGALLRESRPGPRPEERECAVCHWYEGEEGAERLVRDELSGDGGVGHYEGERGAVRMVRIELPGGMVEHYEGGSDAERLVRCEHSGGGGVDHYEGERGAERLSRCKDPSRGVLRFEGERGAERLVRIDMLGGGAQHFEGGETMGAERWVLCELPGGEVGHFEGEVDAERLVRCEEHDGTVHYFEGDKGASCSDDVRERALLAYTITARITESEATWGAMTATDAAIQTSVQQLAATTRSLGGKEKVY